jgi:soluble cytochrome b562
LVIAAPLLASACGGDEKRLTKTEYQQQVQAIYDDVRKAFQGTTTNVASLSDLSARVSTAQQELRDAAERIDDLNPPEEVEEQTHEIAEGLDAYADDLDELRQAADEGDAKQVQAFEEGIPANESIDRIREAAEEIHNKGYNLGALGGE